MNKWMQPLFSPGVKLMQRYTMSAKLVALSALVVLPVGALTLWRCQDHLDAWRTTQAERQGVMQLRQTVAVLDDVRGLRDTVRRLRDAMQPEDIQRDQARLDTLARSLNQHLDELAHAVDQSDDPLLQQTLRAVAVPLRASSANAQAIQEAGTKGAYDDWADALLEFNQLVGERSKLLLDPFANAYFLMDLATEVVPRWHEATARTAELGAVLVQGNGMESHDLHHLQAHIEQVRASIKEARLRLDAMARAGEPMPAGWQAAHALSAELAMQADAATRNGVSPADLPAHRDRSAQALRAVAAFQATLTDRLAEVLDQRAEAQTYRLILELGLTVAVLLLLCYITTCIHQSFTSSLQTMAGTIRKVANGDLTVGTASNGTDEIASISRDLSTMTQGLSTMVTEIRNNAARVAMAGEQLASDNTSLAQRTESQASNLRQTAVAVRELSATAEQTAQTARDVTDEIQRVRDITIGSGDSMREMVESMHRIEGGTQRMGEIVAMIEDIAFQTNMLALNASVEAARAGEAGVGFAVVAGEVRLLANRCAQAASEIGSLIEQSTHEVSLGARRIAGVDSVLREIVEGVREATDTFGMIASASAEQSVALLQVTQAVGNLDDITKHNADMAHKSFDATQELMLRAQSLSQSVKGVRLWQGSSDEAKALVDRAVTLIESQGVEQACEVLHDKDGPFIDRDLYVFVIDRQNCYLAMGADPERVGTQAPAIATSTGHLLAEAMWALADSHAGSGWVDYTLSDPRTLEAVVKTAYVRRTSSDQLVGCGIYKPSTDRAATPANKDEGQAQPLLPPPGVELASA